MFDAQLKISAAYDLCAHVAQFTIEWNVSIQINNTGHTNGEISTNEKIILIEASKILDCITRSYRKLDHCKNDEQKGKATKEEMTPWQKTRSNRENGKVWISLQRFYNISWRSLQYREFYVAAFMPATKNEPTKRVSSRVITPPETFSVTRSNEGFITPCDQTEIERKQKFQAERDRLISGRFSRSLMSKGMIKSVKK